MPRRYHRPPTVKRRKARRSGPAAPYEETAPPPEQPAPDASPDVPVDEAEADDWDDTEEYEDEPAAVAVATEVRPSATKDTARHLQKDYSYVRNELVRIAGLATFLMIALVITAILR